MDADTVNYATIIALSAAIVVGLAMLLLGSRLVRLACSLMGLVLGAAAGVTGAAILGSTQVATLLIIVVAGIIGVLVATLLFRVWASVSAGLVMGITAAVAAGWLMQPDVVTLNVPGTGSGSASIAEGEGGAFGGLFEDGVPDSEETRDRLGQAAGAVLDRAADEVRRRFDDAADQANDAVRDAIEGGDAPDEAEAAASAEQADGELSALGVDAEEVADDLLTALDELKNATFEWIGELWGQLEAQPRMVVIGAGAIVGGVALVFGAVLPTATVTVAAAWLGACLIGLAGGTLLTTIWPGSSSYVPSGPVGQLAVVGLITLLGLGLQWTMGRRKADD